MRQGILAAVLAFAGFCGFTNTASAQSADTNWPNRPVTMVVAYPPGAITDTVGRRVAERLSHALNVQVVVENRGGAGGNVAAAFVSRAQPDGYTLLFTSYGNLIIAAAADLNVGFHPWRDLAPVGMIGPMTTLMLGVFFLNEPFTIWILAGTALVLGGVFWVTKTPKVLE